MKNIIVFTDGACSNNGKKAAATKTTKVARAGIGIHFPNKEYNDISQKFTEGLITNQRAELYAIKVALDTAIQDTFDNITVYTDSLYSIKSLTLWIKKWENNNWKGTNGKTVKNLDLIRRIYQILKDNDGKIKFIHVRSHTGKNTFEAICNDIADRLAVEGSKI